MRRFLKVFNKIFMVPIFRLGLGPFLGNPVSGYVMILRTVGRKSGRVRWVPINYAIRNGAIYCVVGFGRTSPWFLNVLACSDIELIMPGGAIAGHVDEVDDEAERSMVLRQVLKNAGFATIFEGLNPSVPMTRHFEPGPPGSLSSASGRPGSAAARSIRAAWSVLPKSSSRLPSSSPWWPSFCSGRGHAAAGQSAASASRAIASPSTRQVSHERMIFAPWAS